MRIERALSQKISRRAFLTTAVISASGLVLACRESRKRPTSEPVTDSETTPQKEISELKFLWQVGYQKDSLYPHDKIKPPFLVQNDSVYLTNTSEKFTKLNLEDGTPLWPQPWDNPATPLLESDGIVVVVRNDLDRFYGLNAKDGTQKWNYRPEGSFRAIRGIIPPIIFDNLVYFVENAEGYFFKVGVIHPKDGVEIKLYTTDEALGQYSDFESRGHLITVTNERIVVSDYKTLLGLDRQTGDTVWTKEISDSQLAIDNNKLIYRRSNTPTDLVVTDILTGAEQIFPIDVGFFWGLVIDNKAVSSEYIGPHSIFRTLDLTTGEVSQLATGSEFLGNSGEIIYLISTGRDSIISANITTGETLENIEVQPRKLIESSDDKIFILDFRGDLVALDAKTLDQIWKFELAADEDTVTLAKLVGDLLVIVSNQFDGHRAGDQFYITYFIDSKNGQEVNNRFAGVEEAKNLHLKNNHLFIEGEETLTVFG